VGLVHDTEASAVVSAPRGGGDLGGKPALAAVTRRNRADGPRAGRRPRGGRAGSRAVPYLFLAPWFAGLFLITLGPMAASAYLSFTDYSLLAAPEWVGLSNYERMIDDPRFYTSLKVTFTYVFVSVPLQLIFALALALVLDRGVRGLAFYRSVFYLPSLLGASVAIAVLWRQMFGTNGLVNQALAFVGISDAPGWVSDPDTALGTIVLLNVWTFGAPMVIFLAGLRQIPHSYYEAASLDGANKVRQFVSITLPLLSPIIFFNLVLQTIGAFQNFTQAFVVSGGTGGPADSTLFYTLYLYQRGFGNFDMGYASALAWVLVLIIAVLTAINFLASRWWVFYGDD
jgi:multiple sugar transport system permease protein